MVAIAHYDEFKGASEKTSTGRPDNRVLAKQRLSTIDNTRSKRNHDPFHTEQQARGQSIDHGNDPGAAVSEQLQSITANEVRGLLWDFNNKLSKQDMYFRNQEKLMKNAILPEAERQKINSKMRFQTRHIEALS